MKKLLIIMVLLMPIVLMAQYRPVVDAGTLQGLDTNNFVRTTASNQVIGQGISGQVLTTNGAGTLSWTTLAAVSGIVGVDATNINSVKLYRQTDTIKESWGHVHPEYKLQGDYAYCAIGFGDSTTVIPCTQNVYSIITGQYGNLFNTAIAKNITVSNDSVQVLKSGDYRLHQDFSYQGANNDNYHIAFFINGVELDGFAETQRDMSTTSVGSSSASTITTLNAGDWINVRIKNIANNNAPTMNAGNIIIEKL